MRPKGLTAVCVIGFVMAGLGFTSVSTGLFYWFMSEKWMEFWMSFSSGLNQQQAALQQEMMDEIVALQQRWAPFTIAQMILHPVVVVLLFVASLKGIKMKVGAGKLLATAMVFAILFEAARFYPNFIIQRESQEISMRFQNRLMQTSGNPAAARSAFTMMRQVQQITVAVTYLVIGGWLFAKLSYYGIALWYVNRKHVRALFEPGAEHRYDGDGS